MSAMELPPSGVCAAPQCFSIAVDENNVIPGALKLIKKLRPEWDLRRVKTKMFTEGITNKLLACYMDSGMADAVLVRVYGNMTELFVDRTNEVKSFQLLRQHGCAPDLYCTFQNGLCYEFMQGLALGPEEVRQQHIFRLIAEEMAKFHSIRNHNGCVPKSTLWKKLRQLFDIVKKDVLGVDDAADLRFRADVPTVEVLEQELTWMESYLPTQGSPIVLCHNDLLCKNVIYNESKGHVRFIDYEYAGYNYQAFDIANHFNEFPGINDMDYRLLPSQDTQLQWLRHYLEAYKQIRQDVGAVTDKEVETLYVQVNRFCLASHFFWGFWALIQARYSSIEFNFLRYAELRFKQYIKMKPMVTSLEMPE
ncbi:ethanolamine kinase 2 [Ambystoma mexicanum]|uniref:ethanolamine kinase 2 n=1 Tax=Ambystoma mexicanum TaxID=8296 RepID=UPI0037E979EA